jgi:hypothetical protein
MGTLDLSPPVALQRVRRDLEKTEPESLCFRLLDAIRSAARTAVDAPVGASR